MFNYSQVREGLSNFASLVGCCRKRPHRSDQARRMEKFCAAVGPPTRDATPEDLKDIIANCKLTVNKDELVYSLALSLYHGDRLKLSSLLKSGVRIPALTSSYKGDQRSIAVYQLLLDHEWDINAPDEVGNTPLLLVADNEILVRWFLEHGANPNPTRKTISPLDVAVKAENCAIVSILIEHGANIQESSALQYATLGKQGIPMMKFILDLGFDINALGQKTQNGYPGTALHVAAKYGYLDRVKFLLDRGADRNVKIEFQNMTPAQWASLYRQKACYELLKEKEEHVCDTEEWEVVPSKITTTPIRC